jgi:hypothetical protein
VCSADAFNADDQWYDVVRRADKAVIYSFPVEGRYLVYRVNGIVSLRPLLEEEEIFTFNGFMQFAKRLGTELHHRLILFFHRPEQPIPDAPWREAWR